MPYEQMDAEQVASYLHIDLREVIKLASRGQIPCRKLRDGFRFYKSQVDHWVEERMHTLGPENLAKIEKGVSEHHGFERGQPLVCPLIPTGGVAVPLKAKTRASAIRALVDLADSAKLVYAREDVLREIREREELCTTALFPGVALPHPRHPLPYDIAESFVVVGLTPSGIPFCAEDGMLTRLFFLVCCKDDRTHLHVLARLAQMLHVDLPGLTADDLMHAESPDEMGRLLTQCEQAVLGC